MATLTRRQLAIAAAAWWSAGRRLLAAPFVPPRDPQVVAFAPGGTLVATGCSGLSDGSFPPRPHPDVRKSGVVTVLAVESRQRLWRSETFGDFTKLAFSPDGTRLAACRLFATPDGVELDEVRVWDAASGRVLRVLDRCHAFDFSPDGKQLAVLSRSKCVLYDTSGWQRQRTIASLGGAVEVAFSADGLALVGVVRERNHYGLRLAGMADAMEPVDSLGFEQPFYRVAVSPDGMHLATGHAGGNVVLWDAASLDVKSRFQTGEQGLAHPFFSPDGSHLAAGCQANGDVVIWNLVTRQETARYTFEKGSLRTYYARSSSASFRPESDPSRFCFSPGGEAFLVGAYGGILRSTDGGQELARFGE